MKVLVVDDDRELLPLVAFALRQAGMLAIEAPNATRALELARTERPDVVVLDLNLPDMDGADVCRELRRREYPLRILILTARSDEEDEVQLLDLGADDFLTKPFSPRTLTARVRALGRRTGAPVRLVSPQGIVLDVEAATVRFGEEPVVRLTGLETRLVHALATHEGRPVPTERILDHVWGVYSHGDRQLLKQLVRRLRQKIEVDPADPKRILTVHGVGYQLVGDAPHGANS